MYKRNIWTNWSGQKLILKRCAILSNNRTRRRMCSLPKSSWNNEFFTQIKQMLIHFTSVWFFECSRYSVLHYCLPFGRLPVLFGEPEQTALLFRMIIMTCCGARTEIIVGLANALARNTCHMVTAEPQSVSRACSSFLSLKYEMLDFESKMY